MTSTRAIYENYLRAKYLIPNELSVDDVANKMLQLIREKRKGPVMVHFHGDEKVWATRFAILLLTSLCVYILQPVSRESAPLHFGYDLYIGRLPHRRNRLPRLREPDRLQQKESRHIAKGLIQSTDFRFSVNDSHPAYQQELSRKA